jgi:hypothetical protein
LSGTPSPSPTPTPPNSLRLRNPRFEDGKPKRVEYVPGFRDRTGAVTPGSTAHGDLHRIIAAIGHGDRLPERMYRRGVGRDDDALLDRDGIKHVHLGGAASDILLFAVEYADVVVLLEIDHHGNHFQRPIGAALNRRHATMLASIDQAAQARSDARRNRIRAGLLPRTNRA